MTTKFYLMTKKFAYLGSNFKQSTKLLTVENFLPYGISIVIAVKSVKSLKSKNFYVYEWLYIKRVKNTYYMYA